MLEALIQEGIPTMSQPESQKPYITRGFLMVPQPGDINRANNEIEEWIETACAHGYSLYSISDAPIGAVHMLSRVTMELTRSVDQEDWSVEIPE